MKSLIPLFLFYSIASFAQFKTKESSNSTAHESKVKNLSLFKEKLAKIKHNKSNQRYVGDIPKIKQISVINSKNDSINKQINLYGIPTWMEGELLSINENMRSNQNDLITELFNKYFSDFKIKSPESELKQISKSIDDRSGNIHIKFQQIYQTIPVWNAELYVHIKDDKVYLINGYSLPTPEISVTPLISKEEVLKMALTKIPMIELNDDQLTCVPKERIQTDLIIYNDLEGQALPVLAYIVTFYPSVIDKYQLFYDANTGKLLNEIKGSCAFHSKHSHNICNDDKHQTKKFDSNHSNDLSIREGGHSTAQATDLNGNSRTINTFKEGSLYYLVDASRPMFSSGGNIVTDPYGAIWTLNGGNRSPNADNFSLTNITSTNNTWNIPASVSAQYNGGVAYEYFKNKFNRNSINGSGGTIIGIINIAEDDGSSMDNAFWNGQAMFYGNGAAAFKPLAGGLDVAGHEMSHGVIQATANLTYQGESGALNESFADIFAVLIDREDYKVGEDVIKLSAFPSGAMRDVSNPHNGGTSLSSPGWQPAHTNEKYTGSADNGGVHINSGITNFAFFKIASQFGKDDTEKIYYNALTKYLTKSSKFIDCRNAIIQATKDFYSNNSAKTQIVENAFAQVGIGEGTGTTQPSDYAENLGQNIIVFTDPEKSKLLLKIEGDDNIYILEDEGGVASKPSVTDDGSQILWVDDNGRIRAVDIEWTSGEFSSEIIEDENDWRNVAISKNGERFAFLLDNNLPEVFFLDLNNNEKVFELYNPTTADGISTGNVLGADVMEFDHSGQYLMYDAESQLNGQDATFWDIGFIKIWDNATNKLGNGSIDKLFSSLPNGASVGNPTFSKTSKNVIAFDYFSSNEEYSLLCANIETGVANTIFSNQVLAWPSFSKDDKKIIFSAKSNTGSDVIAVQGLKPDKISSDGSDPLIYIENATWGNWFANGFRTIDSKKIYYELKDQILILPNPVTNTFNLFWDNPKAEKITLSITNMSGVLKYYKKFDLQVGKQNLEIDISSFAPGAYTLKCVKDGKSKLLKLIKL